MPQSDLAPGEPVEVTGELSAPDGLAANRALVLQRKADGTDFVALAGSGGLACLDGNKNNTLCEDAKVVFSDAVGRFRFDLVGAETQSAGGFASKFTLGTRWNRPDDESAAGAESTSAQFIINQPELAVPTLHAWLPEITAEKGTDVFTFRYTPLEGTGGSNLNYLLSVSGDGTSNSIAVQSSQGGDFVVPAEVMADYAGEMRLAAWEDQRVGGVDFDLLYMSRRFPFEPGTLVPLSRGASCAAEQAGQTPISMVEPCPLTDGLIRTRGDWSYEPLPQCEQVEGCKVTCSPEDASCVQCLELPAECSAPELLVLDMGESRPASMVVLHGGAPFDGPVELSSDGATWTDMAYTHAEDSSKTNGSYQILQLARVGDARYVRFEFAQKMPEFWEIDLF